MVYRPHFTRSEILSSIQINQDMNKILENSKYKLNRSQKLIRWIAKHCGLLVIPNSIVIEWIAYASETLKAARDYESSDPELSSMNDGRTEAILNCCEDVKKLNI